MKSSIFLTLTVICGYFFVTSFVHQNRTFDNSQIVSTSEGTVGSRDIAPFTAISTSGNVSVTLVKGENPKVDFTVIKGSEQELIIKVEDGELTVKVKGNTMGFTSPTKVSATVYYQNLEKIRSSAGSSISGSDVIKCDECIVDASSGSSASLHIKGETLKASASSGAVMSLIGSANDVDVSASSGASLQGKSFKAQKATVSASSGASTSIQATESIKANASSGGSVKYYGNPKTKNIDSGMYSGGSVSAG